jgi:hypothetical protein
VAKPIIVTLDGKPSTFAFKKIDRKKLYAWRRRMVLDNEEKPCIRAELTRDGSTLFRSSTTAQGYFEESGRWVPNVELVGLDSDGMPVDKQPSTLGEPQRLEGPIEAGELLDVPVQTVYALDPEDLDAGLAERVEAGEIYRFAFNYRADYHMESAYLLANDEGWFVLVGDAASPEWCVLERTAVDAAEIYEDDEDGLDLDFEMF